MIYCHVCGSKMEKVFTDLPFKISDTNIVIIKSLPVLQCKNCSEYLIEDKEMEQIEKIFKNLDTSAELEILRYAV